MSSKENYQGLYYSDRHSKTVHAASVILPFVLERIPRVISAVDFGCGVGTWLSVLAEKHGVNQIRGLDGNWVDTELLEIPKESFQVTDLSNPVALKQRYDLAVSLEVGEHLPQESANDFVYSLCKSSDFVLFSAAIPGQGAQGHVNMQWPCYWAELFSSHDYLCLDIIRRKFWNDEQIPVWYRQNCMLFVNRYLSDQLSLSKTEEDQIKLPISLVHPQFFLSKLDQYREREAKMTSLSGSWRSFLKACKRSVRRLFC